MPPSSTSGIRCGAAVGCAVRTWSVKVNVAVPVAAGLVNVAVHGYVPPGKIAATVAFTRTSKFNVVMPLKGLTVTQLQPTPNEPVTGTDIPELYTPNGGCPVEGTVGGYSNAH